MTSAIKSVLVLGSGALKIGEAGEFDYSGTQALKSLKEEGIRTILLNPNIATVQTTDQWADRLYLLPVNPESVKQIVAIEQPDAILLGFGGQTALNCGVELYQMGFLEEQNIQILGTSITSIMESEDRDRFRSAMKEIAVETAESQAAKELEEALSIARKITYPIMLRAAYTLGGLGGGIANNEKELKYLLERALAFSPQVLIESSLKGWKEIEYEVMRDTFGNAMIVCNMENFDPVGIHTGDSIVLAPSQTLNNEEYHRLRDLSLKIAGHLKIVGACNVQFALHPKTGACRVIEVNARLSRSSALASKATAYPIAYIAAKLALGYGLHQLTNQITGCSSALAEPALDYVVCKIPRWDLDRFEGVNPLLGAGMKSIGEVMGIGGNFEEALQKAIRMLDIGMDGFEALKKILPTDIEGLLANPTPNRLFVLANALEQGFSVSKIAKLTTIDPWFLYKLKQIFDLSAQCKMLDPNSLMKLKKAGFSDQQIAKAQCPRKEEQEIRTLRKSFNIEPGLRKIDSSAGEFPAQSNYLYFTYHSLGGELNLEQDQKSVIVLGAGPYRIGSSVEFDYCAVQCLSGIRSAGYRSVMINCNPETVSTDYDCCDRLYFEELTLERIQDIAELEHPKGIVVSMGGQLPNNLALPLQILGLPILGTPARSIEQVENRPIFSKILEDLDISQPAWQSIQRIEDLTLTNFPLLIRPSFVLSGTAMQVLEDKEALQKYFDSYKLDIPKKTAATFLLTEFVEDALELEFDTLAVDGKIIHYALSEHIEAAGVHSGDATLVSPLRNVNKDLGLEMLQIANKLVARFKIVGLFNIQFLYKLGKIKVIELNLRASRSIPFVSKVYQIDFAGLAAMALLGLGIKESPPLEIVGIGVKAAQFSYHRLTEAIPNLGVVMQSTGEVAAISDSFEIALLNALVSVGYRLPMARVLIDFEISKLETALAVNTLEPKGIVFVHLKDLIAANLSLKLDRKKIFQNQSNFELFISTESLNGRYRQAAVEANIPLMMNFRLAVAFLRAYFKQLQKLELDQ